MALKPLEAILVVAVIGTPSAIAWFVIHTVRKVRRVNAEESDQ